jgi:hypothetical protein
MQVAVIVVWILISIANGQKIGRLTGNILTNITGNQEFEDHIVTSSLDHSAMIRMLYRGLREAYSSIIGQTGARHNNERFQKILSNNVKFPCDINGFKSAKIPTSVHQLRIGDIDIVSAMGDSLTSATSANSQQLWEVLIENRGLSWCIGGEHTWRSHLTLPNIMKVFNPRLFGYSLSDSYNVHKGAQFNTAENIATTSDMPYNARALVERMRRDPRYENVHLIA